MLLNARRRQHATLMTGRVGARAIGRPSWRTRPQAANGPGGEGGGYKRWQTDGQVESRT